MLKSFHFLRGHDNLHTGFRVSFVEKLFDKMVSFNMLVYNCRCILYLYSAENTRQKCCDAVW